MKGLERIRVSVVVGGSSWVCRDVEYNERTMEPNDGIRLPVTEKKRSTKSNIDGYINERQTYHSQ